MTPATPAIFLLAVLACAADAHAQRVTRDIPYATAHERQVLDVYAPAGARNLPVVFWIHGGGWQAGDKSMVARKPQAFTEQGFVFVSTNYRLLPAVEMGELTRDVAKALGWVHRNIAAHGGDPARLLVMGHSAGGQLAALLCTDGRYAQAEGVPRTAIKGCVPVDADTFDIPAIIEVAETRARAHHLPLPTYGHRKKFGDDPAKHREFSAVTHVAKNTGIPPFLILHIAGHPDTTAQARRMAAVLEAAAIPVEVVAGREATHNSINDDIGAPGDPVTKALFAFAAAALGPRATGGATTDREGRREIGVFLRSTGHEDPAKALAAVQAVGLSLIQVGRLPDRFYTPDGAAEFAGLMKEAGVRAASVVIVFDGESYRDREAVERTVGFRPVALVPERLAYARRVIDFAAAIGAPVVTFHVGFLPKDPGDAIYRSMLEATDTLARYAAGRRVTIALETGQETAEELEGFLDRITSARVAVNFDTANLVLYGMDSPPAALKRLLGRVVALHVKDGEPPADAGSLGREMRLGEGRAGVAECLRILREANFAGPLIIENYVWRRTKEDPIEELRRAKAFIERESRRP